MALLRAPSALCASSSRLRKKAGVRGAQLPSGAAKGGQRAGSAPFEPAGRAPKARSWTVSLRQSRLRQQGSQAHQVVGRAAEGEQSGCLGGAAVAQLVQAADHFHPAVALLDELASALAGRVAPMARRAPVEGAPALLAGHVWGHAQGAHPGDEAGGVVTLVGAHAQASALAGTLLAEQPQSGLALGGAAGLRELSLDDEAVAVLDEGVPGVAEPCLAAAALARHELRRGCRGSPSRLSAGSGVGRNTVGRARCAARVRRLGEYSHGVYFWIGYSRSGALAGDGGCQAESLDCGSREAAESTLSRISRRDLFT